MMYNLLFFKCFSCLHPNLIKNYKQIDKANMNIEVTVGFKEDYDFLLSVIVKYCILQRI